MIAELAWTAAPLLLGLVVWMCSHDDPAAEDETDRGGW